MEADKRKAGLGEDDMSYWAGSLKKPEARSQGAGLAGDTDLKAVSTWIVVKLQAPIR